MPEAQPTVSATILKGIDRLRPVDRAAVEAFAAQVRRAEDARKLLDEQGLMLDGSAHPALSVERAASREIRGWVERRPDLFGAPADDEASSADEDDLAGLE